MSKTMFILILCLLASQVISQDDEKQVQQVFIGIDKTFTLTGTSPFVGHYMVTVKEQNIPKNQDKWYFFAMAEPKQSSAQVFGTPSKIQISKVSSSGTTTRIKQCFIVEETDACFVKNSEFDYKSEKIKVSVHCQKQCQFEFITEVDYAYPLELNKSFRLDFENTAYSKIFTLSTEGKDFYQLRIMLQPKGFIKYGQPIVLLASYGNEVPTRSKYDLKGIHTWDDGQGIFLRKSEMKERTLTILVEGPEKNVLSLHAQGWLKQEKRQLMEYWPQFDYLKSGQIRQYIIHFKQNLTHRVKVVTFSGSVEISKVQQIQTDGLIQKTSPITYSMPNKKYGQFQLRFSKQVITGMKIKKILLRILATKESTYVLNYARQEQGISTIHPYISQSSIMQPSQVDQYYLKVEQLIQSTKQKKSSKIQIIIGNINGDVKPSFYKCNIPYKTGTENYKSCEYKLANKQDFTDVSPSKIQNRGGEKRFWFDIEWLDYVKKTDKDKTQIVYQMVILVENVKKDSKSSYQIQYKNKDRIYLLRQGELTKDRVFIGQKRHYKLSLPDSDATQVRIHCTKISGQATFSGSMVDPRVSKQHSKISPEYGVITFKFTPQQKINEVFLQVQGIQISYYSLTTQVIRKSQSNPAKKNGTGYNELIIRQQIPYEFLIAPNDSVVLQVHVTEKTMNLNFKSSSPVQVCMTENLSTPPYPPNCEIRNDYFVEMNEQLTMDRGLVGNIGVKNTNNFNVSLKILITKTNTSSCELSLMNQVMFKMLDKNGKDFDGDFYHCIQYNLNKNAQVELIVELNKQYHYNEGQITASINGQEQIRILSPSYTFSKQQVETACSATKKIGDPQSFCYLKVKFQGIKDSRVRIMAQYTDQAIRLIDGIAHPVHAIIKKNQPKRFFFGIHNYENVTVILQNKIGEYKIYANIMRYSKFVSQTQSNNTNSIFPTKQKKDFESSNPFYYIQQLINIPTDKITEKCKPENDFGGLFGRKWIDCVLLISVVLQGSDEVQKNGKFIIEATQKNRELKDGEQMSGYLQKKSIAFYHYQNQIDNGTILVSVSNQNKNCLDIYLKQGSQRASASNNQKHAKASNNLIYNKTAVGTYSITVQANQNCPYSIVVTSSKNNIGRIKKGTFADINLALGQENNFLFQNLINETFKVLSLHKTGQVIISVKPIPRQNLKQVLNSSVSNIHDWTWSNKDSVRINNVDFRKNQSTANPNYCVDCYYLINIKALRQTEASIIIPTPDSQMPITTDSLIKDLLQFNQSTIYRVFTESSAQFQIYVQYGKIRITIVESNKNITSFNQTFESTKAPVVQSFNLTKGNETYEYLRYSKITITAQQESYFSFAIISSSDPNKRGQSGMKYGLPEYVYLQPNKQKCLVGEMTASIDQFLFSFSKTDKKTLQAVDIVLKVNDKKVSFDKQVGNNEMIIRVNSILGNEGTLSKKFNICLKSKQGLALTIIQSSPLNYWPERESIIVRKESNLTFGAQGKTIVQINECKSRASVEVFSEFNDMKSTSSFIKQRRRTNNIIQFYAYGAIYIKAKAEKATLKWLSVNQNQGKGCGYDDYKSSWIRVLKQGNKIQIVADSIKAINEKESRSKIQVVTYSFYAAKQEMEMYNAMNCGDGDFVTNQVVVNLTTGQRNPDQHIKSSFDILNQLASKFSRFSYFLVGVKAEVNVVLPNGQTENYRFFYPYQQISKQMLTGNGQVGPYYPPIQQQQPKGGMLYTIGYILVALVVVVMVYMIYTKFVKKCFKKKQRVQDSMGKEMKYFDLTQS